MKKRIALISTGGTIEKTYDELSGILENRYSVLDIMLSSLQLNGVDIDRVGLMNKDSQDMTETDHDLIAQTVDFYTKTHDGVVITHGTDRLAVTGEHINARTQEAGGPSVPIVLIGAMKPYAMRTTDALQNLIEALLAVQLLGPGVYCVMQNAVLEFPGVEKDRARGVFVKKPIDTTDATRA